MENFLRGRNTTDYLTNAILAHVAHTHFASFIAKSNEASIFVNHRLKFFIDLEHLEDTDPTTEARSVSLHAALAFHKRSVCGLIRTNTKRVQ